MICDGCRNCPIKDLCDAVDRIVDERLGLSGEHDILLAIYEKGRTDAIEKMSEWIKEQKDEYKSDTSKN